MNLTLEKSLGPDGPATEDDIRATKLALNRLGLYTLDPTLGMNDFTDDRMFDALRTLQAKYDLVADGRITPGGKTLALINTMLAQAGDDGRYIWMTCEDDKVRRTHAARHGETFAWKDEPRPGEEPECRCWAEPIANVAQINDPPVNAVYPEVLLIPLLRSGRIIQVARNLLKVSSSNDRWVINPPLSQLQRKFKHASALGIKGNMNRKSLEDFRKALQEHVDSKDTIRIKGTYRNKPVTHYYNGKTRINLMRDENGDFYSVWELKDDQIMHVMKNGKLGGGK